MGCELFKSAWVCCCGAKSEVTCKCIPRTLKIEYKPIIPKQKLKNIAVKT